MCRVLVCGWNHPERTHAGTGGTCKLHLESPRAGNNHQTVGKKEGRGGSFLVEELYPLKKCYQLPLMVINAEPRRRIMAVNPFEGYFGRTLNRQGGSCSVIWVTSYFPIFLKITHNTGTPFRCLTSAASYVNSHFCASNSHTSRHFQLWGVACVNPLPGMQLAEHQRERSSAPLSLLECVRVGVSTLGSPEGFWEDHNRTPGWFPFTASWYPRSLTAQVKFPGRG